MEIKRTATITLTAQSPKISSANADEYAALLNDLFNDMLHDLSITMRNPKYTLVHLDYGEKDNPEVGRCVKISGSELL